MHTFLCVRLLVYVDGFGSEGKIYNDSEVLNVETLKGNFLPKLFTVIRTTDAVWQSVKGSERFLRKFKREDEK